MNNVELVQSMLAAFEAGDTAMLSAAMTDDFVFSGPVPQPIDKAGFLGLNQALHTAIPDWKFNASSFQENGDTVDFTDQITGTHTGVLAAIPMAPPVPPTGKHIALPVEHLHITVRGGKISRLHVDATPGGGVPGLYAQVGAPLPGM